jgi:ABC-2 type transport system ATP-binding protein
MTVCLEATGLGLRYRRTWALRHCALGIPAGGVTALVGPNGAGKTTLLHLAAGLLRPTEGDIRVLGQAPRDEPELVLARLGFVAQDTPLYRHYSVNDLLRLGRALNRRWEAEAATARLRRLGIPLDRSAGQLSGGQRAQVALAMALAKRPELLLLDEPLASLDPLARRQFLQELMQATVTDGISVILSSHLIADLERVCDRLVILDRGRVRLSAGIDDVVASHRLLVGPRSSSPPAGVDIVATEHGDRQTTLWVRGDGEPPAGWRSSPLSLEDVVLAYLAAPVDEGADEPILEVSA